MKYDEDDLLPLSHLQHLAFCERQWGLIHLERLWAENPLTVEGNRLHERTHSPETETRQNLRIARGLRLHSMRLGLTGKADVVEFHRLTPEEESRAVSDRKPRGVRLSKKSGLWRPVPVEYKRGRPKRDRCDEVQLCAQALCLEEMLGVEVPAGVLFYGMPRRRYDVPLERALRKETEDLAGIMHELFRAGKTPPAVYGKKCRSCSLEPFCLPRIAGAQQSAEKYLSQAIRESAAGTSEEEVE